MPNNELLLEELRLDKFFSQRHIADMFKYVVNNDVEGFEKWLQFELARHFEQRRLFHDRFEVKLEKLYNRDLKMNSKRKIM